eukprot:5321659-Amphidinium_carterae.1
MNLSDVVKGNLMFDSGKEAVGSYIIQSGRGIYTLDILTNGSWTRRDAVAEPIEVPITHSSQGQNCFHVKLQLFQATRTFRSFVSFTLVT